MHFACVNGNLGCVKRLLAAGGSPNERESRGVTPLEMAIHQRHDDIVALIRGSGTSHISEDHPSVAGLKKWLELIGCGEHMGSFLAAGYEDVEFIKSSGLDDDDLDAIGVRKLGHRKRLKVLFKIDEVVAGGDDDESEEDDESDEDESGSEEESDEDSD